MDFVFKKNQQKCNLEFFSMVIVQLSIIFFLTESGIFLYYQKRGLGWTDRPVITKLIHVG